MKSGDGSSLTMPELASISAPSLGLIPLCKMSRDGTGNATVGSWAMYANAHSAARCPSDKAASTRSNGTESYGNCSRQPSRRAKAGVSWPSSLCSAPKLLTQDRLIREQLFENIQYLIRFKPGKRWTGSMS